MTAEVILRKGTWILKGKVEQSFRKCHYKRDLSRWTSYDYNATPSHPCFIQQITQFKLETKSSLSAKDKLVRKKTDVVSVFVEQAGQRDVNQITVQVANSVRLW